MSTRETTPADSWELDGDTLNVFIPMTWKRYGGRKLIIAPEGGDAWAAPNPEADERLQRAFARAYRWKAMLESGKHVSINKIAEAEKIDRAYVCRLLNLTLLAPEITQALLDGRQPKGLRLEDLTKAIPAGWAEQRRHFGFA